MVQDIYNIFKDGLDGLGHYILLSTLVQDNSFFLQIYKAETVTHSR